MKKRGVALVTVLIMTSVLTMMLIGLYASVNGGLLSASLQSKRVAAQYAAEAGLAETMESLRAGGYAQTTGTLSGTLSNGGTYTVEFNDSPPFGPLHSVNNLTNFNGAVESHRGPLSVPPGSALLIVRAEFHGVERVLEAVVSEGGGRIVTQNAIQASGKIRLSGDVAVQGLKELGDTTTVPGNIHSNSSSGTSVSWDNSGGAVADITGTVGALGGAIDLNGYTPGGGAPSVGNEAQFAKPDIQGAIAGKSSSPSPTINSFGATNLSAGDYYGSGDLVINGDLKLNGANLYVKGNLQVNGSITGDGTVYVGGETQFSGDASVSANPDSKVAVLSHGSVTLSGFDGNSYMDTVAASDSTFAQRWSDLQGALQAMQQMVNSNSIADLSGSGTLHTPLDDIRRSIGQTSGSGGTWNGTEQRLAGKLADSLAALPPSPSNSFMAQKLANISAFYDGVDANPNYDLSLPDHGRQNMADAWNADPSLRYMGYPGIFDAAIDSGDVSVMKGMVNLTNQVDYDKIGSSYFQGLVYTEGYLHARNEVNIVGAIMVNGDAKLPSNNINGVTVKPGDLVLENGVKVTFVENFFDGQAGSVSIAGRGILGVETWLGR